MRITVQARGGLSAYGGVYDQHRNEVEIQVRVGETSAVTIEYPSAPTAPSVAVSGVTASAPAVSDNKLTLTLSDLQTSGRADVTATVGGEVRTIRIRVITPLNPDRYGCSPDRI